MDPDVLYAVALTLSLSLGVGVLLSGAFFAHTGMIPSGGGLLCAIVAILAASSAGADNPGHGPAVFIGIAVVVALFNAFLLLASWSSEGFRRRRKGKHRG